jgi:hypothetical protein
VISWPCILKLEGDDELIYLDSKTDFILECSELLFSDDDYVIDSVGFCYIMETKSGELELSKIDKVLSVKEISSLIRAHEFSKASLCLSKIHFSNVSDAIKSLSY